MQDRIERPGAQRLAVAPEFLDHGEAADGLFYRVLQHVETDKAGGDPRPRLPRQNVSV
jgi:hypothetical protein